MDLLCKYIFLSKVTHGKHSNLTLRMISTVFSYKSLINSTQLKNFLEQWNSGGSILKREGIH